MVAILIYVCFPLSRKIDPFLTLIVLGAISNKFQLDLSVVQVKELNFILCSEIFVHYNK